MIHSVAREIMRLVSTLAVIGPGVMTSAFAQRIVSFSSETPHWEKYVVWFGVALFAIISGYSWFRYSRPLYRGENPELLKRALGPAAGAIFFLPVVLADTGYITASVWPVFWGTTLTLLNLMLTSLEPEIRKALAEGEN